MTEASTDLNKCTLSRVTTTTTKGGSPSTTNSKIVCNPKTKMTDADTYPMDKAKCHVVTPAAGKKGGKSSSKWWLWVLIVLVVVGGVWCYCRGGKGGTEGDNKGFDKDDGA